MKLKFLKDGKINGEVAYKAGEVYEIETEKNSHIHWLKRGAIEVTGKEEVVEAPKKEEVKEEVKEEEVKPVAKKKVAKKVRKKVSKKKLEE